MSRFIATRAIEGANAIVNEVGERYRQAMEEKGPEAPLAFPNTAYYLPVILGMLGLEVSKLADLEPVLTHAKRMLHPVPTQAMWTPYLGEALDCGMATLLAEEMLEAIRFAYAEQPEPYPGLRLAGATSFTSPDEGNGNGSGPTADGHLNGPIDDIQLRSWGIQLVDGRMPGFAAVVGAAHSNEAAVAIVRELQRRNILTFLCGNVNGRSIIDQLAEEGVEMGYDTYIVPFGRDTVSAVYPLGFATRSALTFGGKKGGQWREILLYNKYRVFAFVLALGEVDDLKYATAAGAISYGFPVIADTIIPEIHPTGVTRYEHVVSLPWNEIQGETEEDKASRLVQKAIEVRGLKIQISEVPVPVPYGSAFEGEVVRKADMRVEFGGKYSRAFEYLQMAEMEEVNDGDVEIIGPTFESIEEGGHMDLGILVQVAGRQMEQDFEPVLERQIHYFVNGASGIQHIGQRDIAWIRISKVAADKGFNLEHLGKILHARFHADFGAIVDKVQVKIFTEPEPFAEWLETARSAYAFRNERIGAMTDESVEQFYSCTLCQSFAPDHVCIVSPERLGLCGAYNWLDCKASYQINPTGPNQPIVKGNCMDPTLGYYDGINEYVLATSHGTVGDVSMYSIMENPMTACGCFECIAMVVPEANGVMIVSREDTGMTPAGMTFSTLAGMAGGGLQTPGIMGHGKFYILSEKFISADGGFKRIVWMSKNLKTEMADQLKEVAVREGDPDLVDKIADGSICVEVDQLVQYLTEKEHPALSMPSIL
jgi:acetyl-CoA synthase